MTLDVQALIAQLQRVLGLDVVCGQITLNLNESRLQSYETKTYQRLPVDKRLDKS